LIFNIINKDTFNLLEGKNKINLIATEEYVSYPVISIWKLPGTVQKVFSKMNCNFSGNQIHFWADKGDIIGGEETIEFIS
jgi:hypothetical protein